jgi:TonB family protein
VKLPEISIPPGNALPLADDEANLDDADVEPLPVTATEGSEMEAGDDAEARLAWGRMSRAERVIWWSSGASLVLHAVTLALVLMAAAWWIVPEPTPIPERIMNQWRAQQVTLVQLTPPPTPPPVFVAPPVEVPEPPRPEPRPERPPEAEAPLPEVEAPAAAPEVAPEALVEPEIAPEPEDVAEGSVAAVATAPSAPVEVAGPTAADATAAAPAAGPAGAPIGAGGPTAGSPDGTGTVAAAPAARPASEGDGDGDELGRLRARYATTVRRCFERATRYPSALRRDRVEGEVRLGIEIAANGDVNTVAIARSSGIDALDAWALEQGQRIRSCANPPEELGTPVRLVLPIRYAP